VLAAPCARVLWRLVPPVGYEFYVLSYLLDNKERLHDIFKGSWSNVYTFINRRFAREVIWTAVFDEFGFTAEREGKDGKVVEFDGNSSLGLEPQDEFRKDKFPTCREELSLMEWDELTTPLVDYGGNNFIDENLVLFLIGDNNKLKMVKGSQSKPDLSGLVNTNVLYRRFVESLKLFLFKSVRTNTAALPSGTPGETEFIVTDFKMMNFKRPFVPLQNKRVSEATEDNEEVWKVVRDMESVKFGFVVKVALLQEDVFTLTSTWPNHFNLEGKPPKANEYAKRLSLGFADPPWGVNTDATKHGGIDQSEERWSRYD
jgi:hypothetical protein